MPTPIIGIIGGKGKMGRLFASFFKNRGIKVLISDLSTKLTPPNLAQKADIVIISVPIDQTESVILQVLPHLKATSALMDFTSIKEKTLKAMAKAKCEVLGMHPMFGDSNPIPGQTIILCPTKKSSSWSLWIEKFFRDNDVKIIKMQAREHDQAMGLAQGIIHFADISFAEALKSINIPIKEILKYSSHSSVLKIILSARLIAQDPELYASMQMNNPYNLKFLKQYQKSINKLIKLIKQQKKSEFKKLFLQNKKYFGPYLGEAYQESSYLIDKHIENSRKIKKAAHAKPDKEHIALLGPKNTFSDFAAEKYLTQHQLKLNKFYTEQIIQIFDLVEKGSVALGLVPIENNLHGTVRESIDSLFEKKVHIIDEISLPIHHNLITLKHSKKSAIKKIISHPQALAQCSAYLQKNFPKAELQAYSSTAAAITKLHKANKLGIAAIASAASADSDNLKVIAKNIENEKSVTTFSIIKKGNFIRPSQNIHNKTSIVFYFGKDKPGTLFKVFEIFSKHKVNLSKIESRPAKEEYGKYLFFLDFTGHLSDPKVTDLLKQIQKIVSKLKILGTY